MNNLVRALVLTGAFVAAVVAAVPGFVPSARGEDDLRKRATWQPPSPAEAWHPLQSWLADQKLDAATRAKIDALWADVATTDPPATTDSATRDSSARGSAAPVGAARENGTPANGGSGAAAGSSAATGSADGGEPTRGGDPAVGAPAMADFDLLDRVAQTIALALPAARELVAVCDRGPPPILPTFDVLQDTAQPPLVRNNLRLLLGRALAQHALYDEALEQLAPLQPADVLDPAAFLFYQAACHHRLLNKAACLAATARLMENKGRIPRRFELVAELMAADLKPLQTDSLDEIARLMDDIERRLGLGRAGQRVRGQEDDVIAKLDKMIDQLEKQAQQQQAAASAQGGQQAQQPMQDSQAAGGSGPGEVDQHHLGDKSDWGNLPPKQRDEALQQISKGLPSHYRDVIEEYFRKMAREGGS